MADANPTEFQENEKPVEDTPTTTDESVADTSQAEGRLSTPEERFEAALKRFDLTRESAAEIVDDLMCGDDFSREYKLTKKVSVTFRSRRPQEITWITEMIDDRTPNTRGMYEHYLTKFNLAAALVEITGPKGRSFRHGTKEDFLKNLEWVETNSNSVLYTALAQKIHEFDSLLNLLLSSLNIENF